MINYAYGLPEKVCAYVEVFVLCAAGLHTYFESVGMACCRGSGSAL